MSESCDIETRSPVASEPPWTMPAPAATLSRHPALSWSEVMPEVIRMTLAFPPALAAEVAITEICAASRSAFPSCSWAAATSRVRSRTPSATARSAASVMSESETSSRVSSRTLSPVHTATSDPSVALAAVATRSGRQTTAARPSSIAR